MRRRSIEHRLLRYMAKAPTDGNKWTSLTPVLDRLQRKGEHIGDVGVVLRAMIDKKWLTDIPDLGRLQDKEPDLAALSMMAHLREEGRQEWDRRHRDFEIVRLSRWSFAVSTAALIASIGATFIALDKRLVEREQEAKARQTQASQTMDTVRSAEPPSIDTIAGRSPLPIDTAHTSERAKPKKKGTK